MYIMKYVTNVQYFSTCMFKNSEVIDIFVDETHNIIIYLE